MSTTRMLLRSNRVELHPDFLAELLAAWRAGWALTNDQREIIGRAKVFNDDGIDIEEAIDHAKQQIIRDTVLNISTPFWTEFQRVNSPKSKAGSKPVPPSTPSTPSP